MRLIYVFAVLTLLSLPVAAQQRQTSHQLTTVSALPTCGADRDGFTQPVSDATSVSLLGAGGGSATCLALCDGAVWACTNTAPSGSSISAGDSDMTVADAGAGTITATVDASAIGIWDVGGLTIGGADATDQLKLPLSNDAATPTLAFGDNDTGIYESADDILNISVPSSGDIYLRKAGAIHFQTSNASAKNTWTNASGTLRMIEGSISSTAPLLYVGPCCDVNTGLGSPGAGVVSLISSSVEALRIEEDLDTATGNQVAFDFSYTVNKATSGNDTGVVIDRTNTLSPGTSLLLDVQDGGTTQFSVDETGIVSMGTILTLSTLVTAPGTCSIGDFYVDTSGATCACSATDVWSNLHATGSCA